MIEKKNEKNQTKNETFYLLFRKMLIFARSNLVKYL